MTPPRLFCLGLAAAVIMSVIAGAAAPDSNTRSPHPKTADLSTAFDANELLMAVSNVGSFGFDPTGAFGAGGYGMFFPRGTAMPVMFAGGLWLEALVGKSVVVSAADYGFDYAPGPMQNGTFLTDNDSFRVYKINRGDTHGNNPDYAEWPSHDGAPMLVDADSFPVLDGDGHLAPLILGDQTLWSVFNDTDPSRRSSGTGSGPTRMLGLEVQSTVWGFGRAGRIGRMIFGRLILINKGDSTLIRTHATLWADADIGNGADDLFGCDSELAMGYTYNDGDDAVYGASPPAVGIQILDGPPLAALNTYRNGQDPHSDVVAVDLMQGYNRNGEPQYDPFAGEETPFIYSGDPVAGTGWIDTNPSDRRMMVTVGPFDMAPGDQQRIDYAVLVGQGADGIASVADLKESARLARALYVFGFSVPARADLDLLPGDCPNHLNQHPDAGIIAPRSTSIAYGPDLVRAAVWGRPGFDVTELNFASLLLAGVGAQSVVLDDRGGPVPAEAGRCPCGDTLPDGDTDLILGFERSALFAAIGDFDDGEQRSLPLTGTTKGGLPVEGSDCVILFSGPVPAIAAPHEETRDKRARIRVGEGRPNPFNAAMTVPYELSAPGSVSAEVYDVLGRFVATLVDGYQGSGTQHLTWQGADSHGAPAPSGVYFVRISVGDDHVVRKVLLLK